MISGLGQGKVTGPNLPVGAIGTYTVIDPPGGWQIDTKTIQWSGGTNYKSYFTDAATTTVTQDPSLQAVQLVSGVATTNAQYAFIVGAAQQSYTITVNCSYVNPNGGADIAAPPTTVTFSSVRPTVASISGAGGFQSFYTTKTSAILGYSSNNTPWINTLGYGNVISAWTQTGQFGGSFMFMQLWNFRYSWTTGAGVSQHISNAGGGVNLDNGVPALNGAPASNLPIGMALDQPNSGDGWSLTANDGPLQTETSDPATLNEPIGDLYMSVNTVSYYTYLMYMPTGGVWVALAELQWSWTGSATNTPPWPGNSAMAVTGGTASTPAGTAAFPSWTYDSSQVTIQPGL
jgi:hypothetical protein